MSHDEKTCGFNCNSAGQRSAEDPVLAAVARAPMGPPESPEERATVVEAMRSSEAKDVICAKCKQPRKWGTEMLGYYDCVECDRQRDASLGDGSGVSALAKATVTKEDAKVMTAPIRLPVSAEARLQHECATAVADAAEAMWVAALEKAAVLCDDLEHLRRGYSENTVHEFRRIEAAMADAAGLLAKRIRALKTSGTPPGAKAVTGSAEAVERSPYIATTTPARGPEEAGTSSDEDETRGFRIALNKVKAELSALHRPAFDGAHDRAWNGALSAVRLWIDRHHLAVEDRRERAIPEEENGTRVRAAFLYGYDAACKAAGVPYDCAKAEDAFKATANGDPKWGAR